jgi:hypothetical protein
LQLVDLKDTDQTGLLFKLLRSLPHAIEYYLDQYIFPVTCAHQGMKLSASGQELGGDMLFGTRLGFSGTPSDLLPVELGRCHYSQGVDGELLHILTSPDTVTHRMLTAATAGGAGAANAMGAGAGVGADQGKGWSVHGVLRDIAQHDPPYHALIDTGALITGMSNHDVARFLMDHGLRTMSGVVYLDAADRQMILVRGGGRRQ